MSETTYQFDYAMERLRGAIDYAQLTGEFQEARIWSNRVAAAYYADIKAEQELTANATAGAKLIHSLAIDPDAETRADFLSNMVDVVNSTEPAAPVDEIDALAWKDEAIALAADAQDWNDQVSELRNG